MSAVITALKQIKKMEISASTKCDLSFEQAWPFLHEAINKVIGNLEGVHKREFTSEEYMQVYTYPYQIPFILVLSGTSCSSASELSSHEFPCVQAGSS